MLNTHRPNLTEEHIIRHATKTTWWLKRYLQVKSVLIHKTSKQTIVEMPNIETLAQNSNTTVQPSLANEKTP
jgi:hypothetical protein